MQTETREPQGLMLAKRHARVNLFAAFTDLYDVTSGPSGLVDHAESPFLAEYEIFAEGLG
eukprot:775793-Amorphochlora_amoeboformis.AAC.1